MVLAAIENYSATLTGAEETPPVTTTATGTATFNTKDVVTANKALLCQHGGEIFDLARELGRTVCFEAAVADRAAVPMVSRSNSDPLISILLTLRATTAAAHLGRLRHPPGHRSSSASRNFINSGSSFQAWAFNVPDERPCLPLPGAAAPNFVAIPMPGLPPKLRQ